MLESSSQRPRLSQVLGFAIRATFLIPIQIVVMFIAAGTLSWQAGWIYTAIVYLSALVSMSIVGWNNDLLVSAKVEIPKEQQPWDKLFLRLTLPFMLAIFVVAGLDYRWGWTTQDPLIWRLVGIIGLLFVTRPINTWAMAVNRFWSGAVYVQHGEGHQVCDVGPYKYVRHPAYLGGILQLFWPPLILGTLWALIPAVSVSIFIVIRTYFEDRFLQSELPGYMEYVQRVKYRLFPYLW